MKVFSKSNGRWSERYALIGFFFSFTLALFILRRFLWNPGLIEQGDLMFYYDINIWRILPAWDFTVSTPLINNFSLFTLWLAWLVNSTEQLQRSVYLLIFTLMAYTTFLTTFNLLKEKCDRKISCYAASIVAVIIYTLNPLVIGLIGWWPSLLGYSLFPSLLYLIPKAINHPSWKGTAKYGLILAVVITLNFTVPYNLLVSLSFAFFLVLMNLLLGARKDFKRRFFKSLVMPVFIVVLPVLLAAYVTFPYLLLNYLYPGWRPLMWVPLQPYQFYHIGWAEKRIYDVFRLWKWSLEAPFTFDLRFIMTLTVPFVSWLTVAFFRKIKVVDKKLILTLALYSLIILFLGKGINEPFGNFYIWLVFRVSELFKRTEFWIQGLCLSYALLCSFLVAEVVERVGRPLTQLPSEVTKNSIELMHPKFSHALRYIKHAWNAKLAVFLICALLVSTSFASSDLLTGDVNGLLSPAPLPAPYYEVNDWLSRQEGEFRTLWLPLTGDYVWYSQARFSPPPIGHWASSRPVATTRHPLQRDFMDFALNRFEEDENFASLLGLFGVKYLIFHNDTLDIEGNNWIYGKLVESPSFEKVYEENFMSVFLNNRFQQFIRYLDSTILSVSNLNALTLSFMPAFDVTRSAMIFAEQEPVLGLKALRLLTNKDLLLFYNKNFTDLVFSCLAQESFYAPSDYLASNMFKDWRVEVRKNLLDYELDYGKGAVYSPVKGLTFDFNIIAKESAQYEIFARVLFGQGKGKIPIYVDDSKIGTINISTETPSRFLWVKVGDIELNKGEHRLTMVNDEGDGAVNVFAVIPKEEFERVQDSILDSLSSSNVKVMHIFDGDFLEGEGASRYLKIYSPIDSDATLALRVVVDPKYGGLKITVDAQEFDLNLQNESRGMRWIYLQPVYFTKGFHEINIVPYGEVTIDEVFDKILISSIESSSNLDGGESLNPIITYRKIRAEEWIVEVNTATPFILAFSETREGLWTAYVDGVEFESIPLYYQINGFFINKTGNYLIRIEFKLIKYQEFGQLVSSITLFSILICYIFVEDKTRKHFAKSLKKASSVLRTKNKVI